jgi:hypothetical protein
MKLPACSSARRTFAYSTALGDTRSPQSKGHVKGTILVGENFHSIVVVIIVVPDEGHRSG